MRGRVDNPRAGAACESGVTEPGELQCFLSADRANAEKASGPASGAATGAAAAAAAGWAG